MRPRTWTDDELSHAVRESFSIKQTLRRLELSSSGHSYRRLKKRIQELGLDTSHFTKTARRTRRYRLDDVLICHSPIENGSLKRLLLKEGVLPYRCACCNLSEWRGRPISLHLDHLNGVSDDNRLENLRFLCPNCHSQTPTYAGRNVRKFECPECGNTTSNAQGCYTCRKPEKLLKATCIDCKASCHRGCLRCRVCHDKNKLDKNTKILWPATATLLKELETTSYLKLGCKLGVSDNAIRKRIRRHPVK